MRWGVAFIVKEPDGRLTSFGVEHNITSKKELEIIATGAKEVAEQAGYRGLVWSFTHMLDHEGPASECAACHAAVEETLAKEKARGGNPGETTPPLAG